MENAPFKVGDKVTTGYSPVHKSTVRTVISVIKSEYFSSGWAVCADAGDPCPCCGSRKGSAIKGHDGYGIDSGWFEKVEK